MLINEENYLYLQKNQLIEIKNMKNKTLTTSLLLMGLLMPHANTLNAQSDAGSIEKRTLTLDLKRTGIDISPTLSGIFFEDINQSLDGGICAQLIQNFKSINISIIPRELIIPSNIKSNVA